MISSPSRETITALGVTLGLFPGSREAGCSGSSLNWVILIPRHRPVPGTIGDSGKSLGVREIEFPHRSVTAR